MADATFMNERALSQIDASDAAATRMMDEDEFRGFYDRTSRAVWVYLSRVCGDRHQADDLLQETFYRFYRLGAVYESESHRRNSLFCIATNIARDTLRRKKRSPQVPMPEDAAESLPIDDRIAERLQANTDLARAMATLTPLQREMLWLAYALGASHDEIASMLGLKSASIRTLLFRARKKVAAILNGEAVRRTS